MGFYLDNLPRSDVDRDVVVGHRHASQKVRRGETRVWVAGLGTPGDRPGDRVQFAIYPMGAVQTKPSESKGWNANAPALFFGYFVVPKRGQRALPIAGRPPFGGPKLDSRVQFLGTATPDAAATPNAEVPADQMPSGTTLLSPDTVARATAAKGRLVPLTPGQVDPLNIVPPECARFNGTNPIPSGALGANQVVVYAQPYVLASDAQVKAFLDAIYGGGAGGNALLDWSTSLPTTIGPPSFIASGWMRDTASRQTVTRGTLWIALAFPKAISDGTLGRRVQILFTNAFRAAGVTDSLTLTRPLGGGYAATDTSDPALLAAATLSAASLPTTVAVLAMMFGGSGVFTRDAKSMTSAFTAVANKVIRGAQQLVAAPSAIAQTDVVVAQAMAAPHEQAAQTVAALQAWRTGLATVKQDIITGAETVPAFDAIVAAESGPGGALAKRIRDEIDKDTAAAVAQIDIEPGRAMRRCIYYSMAQRSLDSFLRDVSAGFANGVVAAQVLRDSREAIAQMIAALDAAIAKVDKAIEQVPMSTLLRDFLGVPLYIWLAGGATLVIGVAAVAKARRRKREGTAIAKNRRRRRMR